MPIVGRAGSIVSETETGGGGGGAVDSVNGQTGVVVLDAADVGAPAGSGTSTGTNTGDQNTFTTFAVSGQSSVVADSASDTLTLVAGTHITITTDAATDTITISSTGGGGGGGGGGSGTALTTVEANLGSIPRRAGKFTITGLSGLTTNKPVSIMQAVGPYTGKGTRADEAEMDGLIVKGIVTAANTITAYWNAATRVKGNFKFNYFVGA